MSNTSIALLASNVVSVFVTCWTDSVGHDRRHSLNWGDRIRIININILVSFWQEGDINVRPLFWLFVVHVWQVGDWEVDRQQCVHTDDGNVACLQTCVNAHLPSFRAHVHRSTLSLLSSSDEIRNEEIQIEDYDLLHVFDSSFLLWVARWCGKAHQRPSLAKKVPALGSSRSEPYAHGVVLHHFGKSL